MLGAINIPPLRRNGVPHAILHALHIILGEFGIAILLAILAKRLTNGTWATALLAGLTGGAGIFVCYAVAHRLTDGPIP